MASLADNSGPKLNNFHRAQKNTSQALAVLLQVGTDTSCQQYLQSVWSVCSVPLGNGTGPVRVQLPSPTAIANFTASPTYIASAANGASQPPVGLATSSSLSVFVAFGDGSVRDFSRDARTVYAVAAGSAMCAINKGKHID